MADNNFRSYRSRDSVARDEANEVMRDRAGDPLAELARLIGQSDPYAEGGGRDAYSAGRSGNDEVASGPDWTADDGYADRRERREDRYVSSPAPLPPAASYERQEHGRENEPAAASRYFSGPAANFSGFREDAADYRDEQQPVSGARELPAYATAAPGEGHEADEPEYDGGETYVADDYYDEALKPRRRRGLILVMAVLGLAAIGTGAFAYRSMFGGLVLPGLPPIIKASNGPNKIVPNSGESQASNSNQAGAASTGSTENLVSREEQPVNIEPAKVAPRVVATIPVTSGQSPLPPGAAAPGASSPGAPAAPAAPAPVAGSPAAPSPVAGTSPSSAAGAAPSAGPATAPASSEPKKIHTVTIRADQSNGSDTAPVPPMPAPATRSAARAAAAKPSASAGTPPAGSNAPLSIAPGAQGDAVAAAPSHTRTAAAPPSVASAAPVTGAAAAPAGGGYAVQVASQHSEADAQASFQTLRAKFPDQLGGREPIIRRADLGAKGVYYRALVGPFASAEEAAAMCSSLKAAGGKCIVQRN